MSESTIQEYGVRSFSPDSGSDEDRRLVSARPIATNRLRAEDSGSRTGAEERPYRPLSRPEPLSRLEPLSTRRESVQPQLSDDEEAPQGEEQAGIASNFNWVQSGDEPEAERSVDASAPATHPAEDQRWNAALGMRDRPIDAAVTATDPDVDPDDIGDRNYHVAQGIGAMTRGNAEGLWSMPYLQNVGRMAWYDQYGKDQGRKPTDAPDDYVKTWVDAWSGGDQDVPFARELNSQLSENGVKPPTEGGASNWRDQYGPYGETLAPRQKYSYDCGVTAARSMLRAAGYDADQDTMFRDAVNRGAHSGPGGAWNGPERMATYLQSYGLDARTENFNQANIDGQLAEGKPVILSTYDHYFVISGKNEQGQYYTGQSGDVVRRGKDWWSYGDLAGFSNQHRLVSVRSLQPDGEPRSPVQASGQPSRAVNPNDLAAQAGGLSEPQPASPSPAAAPVPPSLASQSRWEEPEIRDLQRRIMTEAPQVPQNPDNSNFRNFVSDWKPALDWLANETGMDTSLIAGLMYAENGGRGRLAERDHNYFSVGYTPMDQYATGRAASNPRFSSYSSPQAALARWVGMMAHPENTYNDSRRGAAAWANRGDLEGFVNAMIRGGYAPDFENDVPQWVRNIRTGASLYREL